MQELINLKDINVEGQDKGITYQMCINFYLVRDDEVDTKDQKENVEIIV